jgi:hypothetical protein
VISSKQDLRDDFSKALIDGLLIRYREIPSAAFVAKEFNFRTRLSEAITQESARRWLRGLAIPEFDKLLVLRSWLGIDLNALGMPKVDSVHQDSTILSKSSQTRQEEYIRATESINKSLRELTSEFERLTETLAKQN